MRALCVDDEYLLLRNMERVMGKVDEISEAVCFTNELKALEWAKENKADIAFLDVQLHVMTGLELAEKLKEIWPDIICVFCTAYSQYAAEAIEKELTDGYLLKPISTDDVRNKVHRLIDRGKIGKKLLTVHLADSYTVYDKTGKQIYFKRSKTESLFWLLVSRNGEEMSTDEICDALWEDNAFMYEQNKKYLWSAFGFLRQVLEKVGASEVLIRWNGGYKLDMSLIEVKQ